MLFKLFFSFPFKYIKDKILFQVDKIRKAKTILQYVYKKNKKIPLSQVSRRYSCIL